MLKKVTHLTVFVNNQDEALKFYTEKLGFTVHTDAPMDGLRWLTLCLADQKDFELAIMQAETPQEKALVGKQGGDKPLFCVESTDCKKDYEKLSGLGVAFESKPQEEPWGISASFKDLYGNHIYMCQPR